MQLTRGEVEKLRRMYEELSEIQWKMTDAIRTVQDRFGEDDITVTRFVPKTELVKDEQGNFVMDEEGKPQTRYIKEPLLDEKGNPVLKDDGTPRMKKVKEEQTITLQEKVLWQEVMYLGHKCEAANDLRAKYPEAIELIEKERELVTEVQAYEQRTFGFTSKQITLMRYIDLTTALLEMLLDERGLKKV